MGQMPPVTKSWGSNAECGKDYKQEREMQIMQVLGKSRESELILKEQRRKKIWGRKNYSVLKREETETQIKEKAETNR